MYTTTINSPHTYSMLILYSLWFPKRIRLYCVGFLSLEKEKKLSVCGVGSSREMAAAGRAIAAVPSFILCICSYSPQANIKKNVKGLGVKNLKDTFFKDTIFIVTLM